MTSHERCKIVLPLLLALFCLTASRTVCAAEEQPTNTDNYLEELTDAYGNEDYERMQALEERIGSYEDIEAAQAKREQRRRYIFLISLMVALIPSFVILKQVIRGEIHPASREAVWRTAGTLLFYGLILFGFNYLWLWVMLTQDTKIMSVILGVALLAFVVYAVYTLNKSKNKSDDTNPLKQ